MKEINQNVRPKQDKIDDWSEVESPNFFQFKAIGDKLTGVLLQKATSSQYGFGLYTIQNDKDEQIRFHGSSQLDDLIMGVNVNDLIEVTFIDTQKMPKGEMKLFKVRRKTL
jgi:hypothetical protein